MDLIIFMTKLNPNETIEAPKTIDNRIPSGPIASPEYIKVIILVKTLAITGTNASIKLKTSAIKALNISKPPF